MSTPTKHRPWNRLPLLKEHAAKQMLNQGVAKTDICNQLFISMTAMNRIVAELRGNTIGDARPTTHCTHHRDCQCVYHRAEAYKAEKGRPA